MVSMNGSAGAIRVLVADDEQGILDAYRAILCGADLGDGAIAFRNLRDRLFAGGSGAGGRGSDSGGGGVGASPPAPAGSWVRGAKFNASFCSTAELAVTAVREALAANEPFAVVFLDMRMPPGRDGVWAAARIRELDPAVEIVVCTAFSDVDPSDIGGMVPPEEKLSYLQKPFHPHEIRQMVLNLASKWRAEHRIVKLAYFDALTGLANREQSRSRLQSALSAARQSESQLALLYLDLDNFKRVNDTLGPAVGDQLLCMAAARLREGVRNDAAQANLIARLGGDEFVVILPNLKAADEAARVAARLIAGLQQPMQLDRHTLVVTPSIGIAMFPDDGQDADTLLRNSDLAMYVAKRRGAGQFAFFDAAMNHAARRRFSLEAQLRGALERGEFALHYQPQFDVHSGGIRAMEALLRWTNAELGQVAPMEFIPVAEETGLILAIGDWVLRTACAQAKAWRDERLPAARIAVNVSGRQFALEDFPARIAAILRETGLPAGMLELEITESVVMNDEAWAEETLRALKSLGVTLAIDDFGTGYSSFGRLRRFAVDRLKIDRSFMTGLADCSDDRAIAAAIIAMSRSLRISVTAEGVESVPQLLFLQENDCQEAQGYLFSHALPAAEAHALLRRALLVESSDATSAQRLRSLIG